MDRAQLAVVGGGVAGTSAALEAARLGVEVTLIDENPLDFSMMALDIPLYFGQRMMTTVRDKGLMLQRIVQSNELLSSARDAGVDVQLGTYVWGSFVNQEHSRQFDAPILGLADDERSWLLEYDNMILATGARDLVFGFPGRHLAGVMGANAVDSLINRYQALTGTRMVILGSGDLGLTTALKAMEHDIDVAGIVDVSTEVKGSEELRSKVEARGVPFYTSHTVKEARGDREVESLVISPIDSDGETEIRCDTVCLAIGLVPNVELANLTGCLMSFRSELGGYVPDRDEHRRTRVGNVYVAGDIDGFTENMVNRPEVAASQGKLAALSVAESLGLVDEAGADKTRQGLVPTLGVVESGPVAEYRSLWLSSLVSAGGMEVNVCPCEEVTRGELLDASPPRFLGWAGKEQGHGDFAGLMKTGSLNLDQVKRITRAGMGHCQGRRCREEIAMLSAQAAGVEVSQVPLASYRPPVRPLPMDILWPEDEPEKLRNNWPIWFDLPWVEAEWRGRQKRRDTSPG